MGAFIFFVDDDDGAGKFENFNREICMKMSV